MNATGEWEESTDIPASELTFTVKLASILVKEVTLQAIKACRACDLMSDSKNSFFWSLEKGERIFSAAMVGKLIGKAGETIKHLQMSTGSRVQIDHQTPGDTKRVGILLPA